MYLTKFWAIYMAVATCATRGFTVPIAFLTPFITSSIGFAHGYDLAGCCLAAVFVVYFFLMESKDRSLEETDNMYLLRMRLGQVGLGLIHTTHPLMGARVIISY
jgi:MFS transporter, SP family, sugar:H+ symporter